MGNLKPNQLLVKCLAFKENSQWVCVCINFDLAVQGDSFEDVRTRMDAQIKSYINEALTVDSEHAEYLLNRKAPMKYAFMFWLGKTIHSLKSKTNLSLPYPNKEYCTALPFKLA